MAKKPEQPVSVGVPVSADDISDLSPAQLAIRYDYGDDAPSEQPVSGYEPLYVPRGVSLLDILERLDALEAHNREFDAALKKAVPSAK